MATLMTYPSLSKVLGCLNHARNTSCCVLNSKNWRLFFARNWKQSRNSYLAFRWLIMELVFNRFVMNVACFSSRFGRFSTFTQPFGWEIVLINTILFRMKVPPSHSSLVILRSFSSRKLFAVPLWVSLTRTKMVRICLSLSRSIFDNLFSSFN